jgi:hypothetical protein
MIFDNTCIVTDVVYFDIGKAFDEVDSDPKLSHNFNKFNGSDWGSLNTITFYLRAVNYQ